MLSPCLYWTGHELLFKGFISITSPPFWARFAQLSVPDCRVRGSRPRQHSNAEFHSAASGRRHFRSVHRGRGRSATRVRGSRCMRATTTHLIAARQESRVSTMQAGRRYIFLSVGGTRRYRLVPRGLLTDPGRGVIVRGQRRVGVLQLGEQHAGEANGAARADGEEHERAGHQALQRGQRRRRGQGAARPVALYG